jgi:hypothetical protein
MKELVIFFGVGFSLSNYCDKAVYQLNAAADWETG